MENHDLTAPIYSNLKPLINRIQAATVLVEIDTDPLFTPAQSAELARRIGRDGALVERMTLRSAHGHDAFPIEWDQMAQILRRVLAVASR